MAIKRLIIVGDLFPVDSNMDLFYKGDVKQLFGEKICDLFAAADYRICNLEGALTDGKKRMMKTGPIITAPTKAVNAYKTLGIDYCMLANNHITDAGTEGVEQTIGALDRAGIQYIGAGLNERSISHYVVLSLEGKTICIYNVSETMYNKPSALQAGAWLYDEYIVCKEIQSLKSQYDHVVVIYHGGIEKFRYPSPETIKRFHRMADSGADAVLSQHTHCIGCEEYYKGSYLLYGQGDFLFNNFRPGLTDTGIIVELVVEGDKLSWDKHMVECSDKFHLRYVENPDFSEFKERSSRLNDNTFVYSQFQEFCKKELRLYLTAFKSPGLTYRLFRKFFPKRFNKWLRSDAFHRKDLMFALHTLRSEQNRETAIVGIEQLIEGKELS